MPLALAIAVFFIVLLVAMPWKRPDPNHVFALAMLERLADRADPPTPIRPAASKAQPRSTP